MEGCICRWCNEGEYVFGQPDECTCDVVAPCWRCEESNLQCTVCGEAPMTFDEAERERGRQIAEPVAAREAQPEGLRRVVQGQRKRLAFGRRLAVRSRHARASA